MNFLLIKLMVAGPMMVGSCCVAHFRHAGTGPVNVIVEIPAEDPKDPVAETTQETELVADESEDSN